MAGHFGTDRKDRRMTLAAPIPELSVVMVSDQHETIVHVYRNGEAYEVEFSNSSRVAWVLS